MNAAGGGYPGIEIGRPRVAVIIPALNEERSVGLVLGELPRSIVDQVIVADNGSSDGTARVAESYGATVWLEPVRGYGAACLAGLKAVAPEIEIVVFLDADYSDYPEELERLVSPIAENRADFVIGSRTMLHDARNVLSRQQRWGNGLAAKLIEWRFGHRYTDLGPFRAIRRDVLEALSMTDRGYGWTVEMQVRAVCHDLRIMEVPVSYRRRIGHSKISGTLRGSVSAGAKILWTIARHSLAFESCSGSFPRRTAAES